MTLYRVAESFPFDSSKPTKFDDYGRPILDRAVSSRTMRDSLAKIFSNGVFGKPADAFIISKGDGLNVRINPGMCVIDGAMGGWREEQTFALPAATGKVAYGIFLRLDDNSDMRSIYVRIDAGAAGSNPTPPAPESGDKVTELRLGYVVVPSGATDLSSATVTNEKGLEVCPYTAPFAEIDLAEIIHDAQTYADARNEEFTAYLLENMEFIASCLDGTVAGNLQSQIDDLRAAAFSADNVDPRNLEIEADTPTGTKLLRISDNFVDGTLAKIDAETRKLALQVQAIRKAMGLGDTLGVLPVENGGHGGCLPVENGGFGGTTVAELRQLLSMTPNPVARVYASGQTANLNGSADTRVDGLWASVDNDDFLEISDGGVLTVKKRGLYRITNSNLTAKISTYNSNYTRVYMNIQKPTQASNQGSSVAHPTGFSASALERPFDLGDGYSSVVVNTFKQSSATGFYMPEGTKFFFSFTWTEVATVSGSFDLLLVEDLSNVPVVVSS